MKVSLSISLHFLNQIGSILNSMDVLCSFFSNCHSKLLLQSHHNLNLFFILTSQYHIHSMQTNKARNLVVKSKQIFLEIFRKKCIKEPRLHTMSRESAPRSANFDSGVRRLSSMESCLAMVLWTACRVSGSACKSDKSMSPTNS